MFKKIIFTATAIAASFGATHAIAYDEIAASAGEALRGFYESLGENGM
ncbi:hypothetical protein HOD08_04205, partial [bacterium]|nr:hypothetical protein [bacterium]